MKRLLLASIALSAVTVPALAADMAVPVYKAPAYAAPPPAYTWTGLYIGGHIGGAFADDGFGSSDDGRFLGGGQIGANYQFSGSWLLGVEAQYSVVDNQSGGAFTFPGGTFSHNIRGLGSVAGRLGYTTGPTLFYVKGGYAYADIRDTGTGAFQYNDNRDGYTIGGGIEYMFTQNWSGNIEYQYYDFGRSQLSVGAPLVTQGSRRDEEQTIKAGLNYHFNLGNPMASR